MAMMSKKSAKLAKLKMPEDKKPEMSDEMDMGDEEMPGEEMAAEGEEMPLDFGDEPEAAPAEASQLDEISDEELLAELRKRGLSSELGEESAPEADEELEA